MTGPGIEVHDVPPPASRMEMEKRREKVSHALALADQHFAIEELDDDEFAAILERDKKKEARVKQFVLNRLQDGIHFGKVPGIDKPFAWEGAADELCKLFRFAGRPVEAPVIFRDADYVEATVTVGIYDLSGRCIATATRSCNTLEKRFYKGGTKAKFRDPRECLNECVSMATKRAKVAAALAACSAKPYFASPELLEGDEPEPCTAEERKEVFALAKAAGIKSAQQMGEFVKKTLGRDEFYQPDLPKLKAAIEGMNAKKTGHLAGSGKDDVFAEEPEA